MNVVDSPRGFNIAQNLTHVENFRLSFALEGRGAGISINALSENAISFHVQAKLLKVNFFMREIFLQMVPTKQVNLPVSWLYKPLSFWK